MVLADGDRICIGRVRSHISAGIVRRESERGFDFCVARERLAVLQVDAAAVPVQRIIALPLLSQLSTNVAHIAQRQRRSIDEHAPPILGNDLERGEGRRWKRFTDRPLELLTSSHRAKARVLQNEMK